MKMNYGEEAELICRMLADRGAELVETHYAGDPTYYNHSCEGLTFDTIAENLWQCEDSLLHIAYKGRGRWLRFIFGNSFGELVSDYSGSAGDNLPIDNLIESVLSQSWGFRGEEYNAGIRKFGECYTDLPFKEVTRLMTEVKA
tara:strand:- start:1803 stop:2231 length:429 start_codon:yes stop_codon:yes gene_type:complete